MRCLGTLEASYECLTPPQKRLLSAFARAVCAQLDASPQLAVLLPQLLSIPEVRAQLMGMRLDMMLALLWQNRSPRVLCERVWPAEHVTVEEERGKRTAGRAALAVLLLDALRTLPLEKARELISARQQEFLLASEHPEHALGFARAATRFLRTYPDEVSKFLQRLAPDTNCVRVTLTTLYQLRVGGVVQDVEVLECVRRALGRCAEDYLLFDLLMCLLLELCRDCASFFDALA